MATADSEDLVKIHVTLNDYNFGIGGESLWAKSLGDDLYEIRNTPWHTCSLGWGDIVRAVAEDDTKKPEFIEIVQSAGHRTLHIFFFEECPAEDKAGILKQLKRWKASYENADGKLYAVDVEPEGDFDGLCKFLDELEKQEKLSYRTVVTQN